MEEDTWSTALVEEFLRENQPMKKTNAVHQRVHDGMPFFYTGKSNDGIVGFYVDRNACVCPIKEKSLYASHIARWLEEDASPWKECRKELPTEEKLYLVLGDCDGNGVREQIVMFENQQFDVLYDPVLWAEIPTIPENLMGRILRNE